MEIQKKEMIHDMFIDITKEYLSKGENINNLKKIAIPIKKLKTKKKKSSYLKSIKWKLILICFLSSITLSIIIQNDLIGKLIYDTRCYLPNNYLIWEFSRPNSNCNFCRNVKEPIILPTNITRNDFLKYAYSSKPIVVKNGAKTWKASSVFSIEFFKNLYDSIDGAYESIEEDCQFLNFKTNFTSLKQVFYMSHERAMNIDGKDSWYVGWKNCHPGVLSVINQYYETPSFLPLDAEVPQTNYIFMGYEEGASMHLDYIPRLMWQGQVLGRKTWEVAPTPECDNVCERFTFNVDTGDVVLLDTRVWYHATIVRDKNLSLTITSEYG
ncbi:hypothetical protein HCN44_002225 [Aphidius gifuensis]|uniref:Uncharacterized protein n=1 Tax=Aphidius gifuensis TaxID=684658 RepID=A0A834Y3Q8_APHGI|nr:uncharacterized protein LOC122860609 [Aphidius gifuensis]KAF7996579.1 hypothetical protein HCN44_002225 [Aphidius gifuensis]